MVRVRYIIQMTKLPMMGTGRMISFMGMVRFTMRKSLSFRPHSSTRIGPKSKIFGLNTKDSLSWTIRKAKASSISVMAKFSKDISKMTRLMAKACSVGKMEPESKVYGEKINLFVCIELIHSSLPSITYMHFYFNLFLPDI